MKAWEATVRKSQAAAKKRANGIFNPASVAHADDADDTAASDEFPGEGEVYHAEKVLPNGDFFTGQWAADNLPHGHGKYLWTDGCMYVGEWFRGKTMGKGRFSWPSGATYEGDFKTGFMDGKGTYTGSSGDTYRGSWVMNLKHGHGTKNYANGDYYDGEWRHGSQDGHGRYQWKNGNHYTGNWRNGVINGNGTMVWSNGNRYDGDWEDGLPKGNGTFRWVDGSFYVGVWSKEPIERSGSFCPSGSAGSNSDWDPHELYSGGLSECRIFPGEEVSIFPSQKMPDWLEIEREFLPKQSPWRPSPKAKGARHKPRRRSVDGRLTGSDIKPYSCDGSEDVVGNGFKMAGRDGDEGDMGNLQLEDFDLRTPPCQWPLRIRPAKRPGETISKGHKNYELMLNLQLGIRYFLC